LIKAGDKIDREMLINNRVIKTSIESVVLLANGELTQKVDFFITKATPKASAIVEAAGGAVSFE